MSTIEVRAASPYCVHIEGGALRRLPDAINDATRVAILHAPTMGSVAQRVAADLPEPLLVPLPDAEAAKTSDVLVHCWGRLAQAGFTRNDLVVGLGGGATTDLAGFVAATWLRGVSYVAVPTTVLGMVDAAVGGKTGINIAAGKNLVGAFHEPRAVLCDLDLLATLPGADVRAGLAEVVKCGFIRDTTVLDLVEEHPAEAMDVTSPRFADLVHRAVQVKADTVSADLREATSQGERVGREALNYGHTLGHAIEKIDGFAWRHGEAISVGMVFAAELSRRDLGLSADAVQRHRDLLRSLELPVSGTPGTWEELRAAMALDKKARGHRLRFVGLPALGRTAIIDGPDEDVLRACHATLQSP